VKAGEPVQLFVQAAGMRIATTAIPLALGREGDRIRVHAALNGKILVATVVARQTVEVDY
jgi:flagella basal body P-ring formation protein FlgA